MVWTGVVWFETLDSSDVEIEKWGRGRARKAARNAEGEAQIRRLLGLLWGFD